MRYSIIDKKLLRSLAPRTVYDIGQILKSMADEFLVHISRDGDYIEGLHPFAHGIL